MKALKFMTVLVMIVFVAHSCKSDKKEQLKVEDTVSTVSYNFIEVIAKDFTFTVDDTISSGWSTFRMKNTGMMDHFFLLTKLPDSLTIDDYLRDVAGAFGVTWEAIKANKPKDEAFGLLGQHLPEWYASAKAMGGAGLISGGETAINTLKLEPGYYVMECYVKTENGQFHTELGMINPLIVSEEVANNEPPESNVQITLSNDSLQVDGYAKLGLNVFSVYFKDQSAFGLGNDIHIVKVNDSTNLEEVSQWMDWSNLKGLVSPGPGIFVGGTQEMPTGYTSYFKCNLEPGKYAFIAETPVGRFKTFTVR